MRPWSRMPIPMQFPGVRANQLRCLFESVETRLMGWEVSGYILDAVSDVGTSSRRPTATSC